MTVRALDNSGNLFRSGLAVRHGFVLADEGVAGEDSTVFGGKKASRAHEAGEAPGDGKRCTYCCLFMSELLGFDTATIAV
jgi:hypothetical protein